MDVVYKRGFEGFHKVCQKAFGQRPWKRRLLDKSEFLFSLFFLFLFLLLEPNEEQLC